MPRELRNALQDFNTAKEYAGNALSNMADYYDPRIYAQFARNPMNLEEADMERRAQEMAQRYAQYGVNEGTEYLGTPVMPMMLPASLAFRGGQSVGQAMRGMGAYSPRADFLGQARETGQALGRARNWLQSEFF